MNLIVCASGKNFLRNWKNSAKKALETDKDLHMCGLVRLSLKFTAKQQAMTILHHASTPPCGRLTTFFQSF